MTLIAVDSEQPCKTCSVGLYTTPGVPIIMASGIARIVPTLASKIAADPIACPAATLAVEPSATVLPTPASDVTAVPNSTPPLDYIVSGSLPCR